MASILSVLLIWHPMAAVVSERGSERGGQTCRDILSGVECFLVLMVLPAFEFTFKDADFPQSSLF